MSPSGPTSPKTAPPASCATALEALRVLKETPELPKRLLSLARYMRDGLHARGIAIVESETPIIPIYTYEALNTLTVAKELYDAGAFKAENVRETLMMLELMDFEGIGKLKASLRALSVYTETQTL